MTEAALGDHVWQSTLFAAAVGLLTLVLRQNRAQLRYWLWLCASVKFLVPFAALVALGSQFGWATAMPVAAPAFEMVETVTQPFAQSPLLGTPAASGSETLPLRTIAVIALLAIWVIGAAATLFTWGRRWRRIAAIARHATPLEGGREVGILRRLELHTRRPLPVRISDVSLEPGVFGIVRPVLLWPRSISARLSDAQIEAILAHELAHVRRRDNLTAAIHMAVQAAFWFHPLAWWIGARLVDERERACDEEVVRMGSDPEVYAESILKTCQFYVESPLACVAGVTGSDLKSRIEHIMNSDAGRSLGIWKRTLLVAAGVSTFVAPVTVGALNPAPRPAVVLPAARLPSFQIVSIRLNRQAGRAGRGGGGLVAGRYQAQNVTLRNVIKTAYGAERLPLADQQVVGGPDWLASGQFDIEATTAGPAERPEMQLMLQRMLADRFKLRAHFETRELPVYVLTRAAADGRRATRLVETPEETCKAAAATAMRPDMPGPRNVPGAPGAMRPPCGSIQFGPGVLIATGAPMDFLAQALANVPVVTGIDRMVLDRTGLSGNYGFNVKFKPASRPPAQRGQAAAPDERPSLIDALRDQLDLELQATRARVDVLVVDNVERPEEASAKAEVGSAK